jgi:hypothetical protein
VMVLPASPGTPGRLQRAGVRGGVVHRLRAGVGQRQAVVESGEQDVGGGRTVHPHAGGGHLGEPAMGHRQRARPGQPVDERDGVAGAELHRLRARAAVGEVNAEGSGGIGMAGRRHRAAGENDRHRGADDRGDQHAGEMSADPDHRCPVPASHDPPLPTHERSANGSRSVERAAADLWFAQLCPRRLGDTSRGHQARDTNRGHQAGDTSRGPASAAARVARSSRPGLVVPPV